MKGFTHYYDDGTQWNGRPSVQAVSLDRCLNCGEIVTEPNSAHVSKAWAEKYLIRLIAAPAEGYYDEEKGEVCDVCR